jgi:hypothetical protein
MRNAVILGSGRSGTSMVGGLFHGAGAYMGPDLLPPLRGNPKGLFESSAISQANESCFAHAVRVRPTSNLGKVLFWPRLAPGQLWLAELTLGTKVRDPAQRTREEIERWTSHQPFAFKDPRFCYSLDAWRPWLEDCVFVCVFREPGRTADSILRECREERYLRNVRMTRDRALRVWERMYEWVLRRHAGRGEWVFVHYDQVVNGVGVKRLAEAMDANLDADFAERGLSRASAYGDVPTSARTLYEELCDRARHPS